MQEARRLYDAVDRPNVMIKIPGRLPAIEEMLYEGVNINITLLFAIQDYEAVTEQLQHEGVQKFIEPFDALMQAL